MGIVKYSGFIKKYWRFITGTSLFALLILSICSHNSIMPILPIPDNYFKYFTTTALSLSIIFWGWQSMIYIKAETE